MNSFGMAQKNMAYQIVTDYLKIDESDGFDATDYIQTIAEAALRHVKKDGAFCKKWQESIKSNSPMAIDIKTRLEASIDAVLISVKSPWKPSLDVETKIQKIIFQALRNDKIDFQGSLKTLLIAVVWKKNDEILSEGRNLLQNIFTNMIEEINNSTLSEIENFQMEVIIGDLLALYPFLGPVSGEELRVPILINEKWVLGSYNVDELNLTPKWMGSPITCVGLEPKESHIPPLLLFKGTTYPTDSGFNLSLITDLNPLGSVGSYAFRLGKKKIENWLDAYTKNGKKAILFGKSLGGAQSWRTALHFPDKVEKVMAYGSPGLSIGESKRWTKIIERNSNYPEINMLCQKGDSVPYQDRVAKRGFNYYLVLGEKPYSGISSHAHLYSTHKHCAILKMDDSLIVSKWKRISLSVFRHTLSFVLFPLLIIGHAIQTAIKKIFHIINRQLKKISRKGYLELSS